jgi:hypothetical protein
MTQSEGFLYSGSPTVDARPGGTGTGNSLVLAAAHVLASWTAMVIGTTITPRPPHPMDDAAEAHGRPEDAGVAKTEGLSWTWRGRWKRSDKGAVNGCGQEG